MTEPWEVRLFSQGNWRPATICWEDAGPVAAIDDKKVISTKVKLHFDVLLDEVGAIQKVRTRARVISLEPEIVFRGRFARVLPAAVESKIYPPSTNLWYTRWLYGTKAARFFLYPILGSNKYFLVVVQDGQLVQAHTIEPYEACALRYRPWSTFWTSPQEVDEDKFDPVQILDKPLRDWACLTKITDGANLCIDGDTMGECLDEFVPPWPEGIRNELKAFLLFLCKPQPKDDPLDFFPRFGHVRIFYSLLMNWYMRRESDQSSYVREFWLAHADIDPKNPTMPEGTEGLPWMRLLYRVHTPLSYYPELTTMVQQLNRSQQVITTLPISRKKGKQSKDAWRKRTMLISKGMGMRLHVRPRGIGLREVIYIGGVQVAASPP